MTQEHYDAMYAQNCPECPYNHFDGDLNHCSLENIFHHIFKKKPRWCPFNYEVNGAEDINERIKRMEYAESKLQNNQNIAHRLKVPLEDLLD